MFFRTAYNNKYYPALYAKTKMLSIAYLIIKKFPMGPVEHSLEEYLKLYYKKSLKDLCIEILLNIYFYKNNNNELILLFKDKKYDKIAQIITYGTGNIPGSKILQTALKS